MDAVLEQAIRAWWWLQALPWGHIVAFLGSSGVIVTATQFFKKHLNKKSKVKILSFVGILATVPDLMVNLFSNISWVQYLPDNFAYLGAGAVFLHAVLETKWFRQLRTVLTKYKLAIVPTQATDSAPVSFDNPNLQLNQPSVSEIQSIAPPKPEVALEEKPLIIQG